MESAGDTANDYRDQRDVLLNELSELIDIDSFENANGGVTVSVGSGQPLVEGTNVYRLSTQVNGFGNQNLVWVDAADNTVDITAAVSGGKIKGWLNTRDLDIRNYLQQLDTLAQGLMDAVNTLHASGYGLDGSTGNDFFTGAATASGVLGSALTITAQEGGAGNISITLVGGGTAGSETVTTDPLTGDIRIAIEARPGNQVGVKHNDVLLAAADAATPGRERRDLLRRVQDRSPLSTPAEGEALCAASLCACVSCLGDTDWPGRRTRSSRKAGAGNAPDCPGQTRWRWWRT